MVAPSIRDRAIMEALYSTGLRRMELARLKTADVSFESRMIIVRAGKGGRDRVVPLGTVARSWIERYLRDVRPTLQAGLDRGELFLTDYGEPPPPIPRCDPRPRHAAAVMLRQCARATIGARRLEHSQREARRMQVRRIVSSAFSAALLLFAAPVSAQWWNLNDHRPPKEWHADPPPKVVYTHQVMLDEGYSANAAFWNEQFAKLDRMYDEMLKDGVRATDGTSMIQPFAQVFEQAGSSPAFDQTMQRWAHVSPDSKLRPLAQAVRLEGDAWRARGGAYDSPEESMKIFQEKLAAATHALQQAEPEGRNSPIWYWVALIVAGSSERPAAQFDALFDEAAGRFPYYQPLYYTRVNYLLPQWGGNWAAVDRFVNESVARTSASEGDAFYAWIYVDVATKVRGDLFENTLASWPRMKKGFEDMIARHPDVWNKNLYATWACRARDKETTARLLVELGKDAHLGAASEGVGTESCRRFAESMS